MKKVFILAAAAIMMATATVKAEDNNNNVATRTASYDIQVNVNSLSRLLKLDEMQIEVMTYASETLQADIAKAENEKEVKRPEALRKALNRNLTLARNVMNPKQYRSYLSVLNTTLTNKGLSRMVYMDQTMAME